LDLISVKKKADLGNSVTPISEQELRDIASEKDTAHMRAQQDPTAWRSNFNTEESNKFTSGPPRRDNYRMALPYALAQANLSAEERVARDAAEKQELIKEKYLVDQNKQGYQNQIQEVLAKRKRNKIEDLVAGLNLKG